jgi:hypothetical protein
MRRLWFVVLLCSLAFPRWASANDIAPGGTLRAVYLGSNPAQAVRDRATGAIRGASADLARELGKRINVPVELKPAVNPQGVIDAVSSGAADIGFVAYEPSRAGTVEFSQTYMLVQQSFLVLDGSPIRAVADIDRAGQVIAGVRNDSITLYLKRKLKQATLLEVENNPGENPAFADWKRNRRLWRQPAAPHDADGRNAWIETIAGQPLRRPANHHRAQGQGRRSDGRQQLHRRCARVRLFAERDRKQRGHRPAGGAGRLLAAFGAGLITVPSRERTCRAETCAARCALSPQTTGDRICPKSAKTTAS